MCGCGEPRWAWGRCAPSPMLLLSLLLSAAPFGLLGEETRQVSLEVIPGWLGSPQNLLHIRAVGTNSTLHYVWSSLGPPAVLLVATNTPHSSLVVNWSCLLSPEPDEGLMVLPKDSIQFSSALVFTRLFEFDSTNVSDVAAKFPGKPYPPYPLAEFSWNNITDSLDPATLSATFRGHPMHDPTNAFANGSLAFRVQAFSGSGRPIQPPRLLHTADTCQLEVALCGASPRGNRSLFGLEVATLSQGPDCPSVQEQLSIDDEYTPAVFQSPIVRAFFGSQTNFCAFNLTFGASTGPGYWDHYYFSWSMLLGVGSPPVDTLSALVLGIMAVALGAPGLMLLGGGLILLLRHKRYSEYQPIN
ncbi:glycosylated lysosomal membrane protein isoform X2 [Trichechus manatus latirostris]|uniref:Glycosylated lysosomal membrane protein n=1 Tax=Trichechus manatus latirostris TaxID=127582 RepID=A0A2Y9S2Q1_TRIMA|nr:glycosylated lysosomal membrane protein isoform X2 [Trichechus manatus latirostris]